MGISNHWRNKQLADAFVQQELLCIDFVKQHSKLAWQWHGPRGGLYDYCAENFIMSDLGLGLLMVNYPSRATPKQFVDYINMLITADTQAAYLAVNRFDFVAINDLEIDYDDSIERSIEQIVEHICVPFQRLKFDCPEVDGNHFVGVHGLDIFTYERN